MAKYTFYTPQVMEGFPSKDRWWRRVVSQRGEAVVIKDGVLSLARAISEDEMAAADYVFLGGRNHIVSETIKDVLVGQGFVIKTQAEADTASNAAHDGFLVQVV